MILMRLGLAFLIVFIDSDFMCTNIDCIGDLYFHSCIVYVYAHCVLLVMCDTYIC